MTLTPNDLGVSVLSDNNFQPFANYIFHCNYFFRKNLKLIFFKWFKMILKVYDKFYLEKNEMFQLKLILKTV